MLNEISGERISTRLPGNPAIARLERTCAQFESLFLNYILKSMRSTVPGGDFFGDKNGGEIVRSMFDESLSNEIANGSGMGLGQVLFEQLRERI
jgi:peptidoglycan hydrolase FlgJ